MVKYGNSSLKISKSKSTNSVTLILNHHVVFYLLPSKFVVCCYIYYFIIIFLGSTYSEALNLAGISALQDRRSVACLDFIAQLNPDNPLYKLVASRLEFTCASAHYSPRSRDRVITKTTATNRFGDFVTNKYDTDST